MLCWCNLQMNLFAMNMSFSMRIVRKLMSQFYLVTCKIKWSQRFANAKTNKQKQNNSTYKYLFLLRKIQNNLRKLQDKSDSLRFLFS